MPAPQIRYLRTQLGQGRLRGRERPAHGELGPECDRRTVQRWL